VSKVSFSS